MAAQPIVTGKLGDVLSPSQTKTLITCAAKWYFKYLRGLPETTDGALALGRALHAAVEQAMKWKRIAKRDMELAKVHAAFMASWTQEMKTAELRADENAAELEAMGETLVAIYMREVAPGIEPALVEHEVSGSIGGVRVRGWVDLVDVQGTIIDLKTKGPRGRVEITPDDVFQVATYRRLCPVATGKARLDILRRLKTPKADALEFDVTEADLRFVDTMYPLARDVIQAGLYMPNRSCRFCSRKYCSFWRACETEFGGEVEQ